MVSSPMMLPEMDATHRPPASGSKSLPHCEHRTMSLFHSVCTLVYRKRWNHSNADSMRQINSFFA
jgi:hypothetical protein